MTKQPTLTEELRARTARPAVYLYRAAAAHVRGFANKTTAEAAARSLFGSDVVTDVILRAASSPATTGSSTWAGALAQTSIDDSISAITSQSAAAGLIQRGTKTSFGGAAQIKVPGHFVDASDAGGWVGEGQPVKVRAQRFTSGPTLVPRTMRLIVSFTNEMVRSSNIEAISRALITEATALLLDQAMFGTQADDGNSQPGS